MIDFEIPDELRSIVCQFGIDHNIILRITFTEVYNRKSHNSLFTLKDLEKSIRKFEKGIMDTIPTLSRHEFNLIEDTIFKNLHKLEDILNNKNNIKNDSIPIRQNVSIKYLRKYELDSIPYEGIIIDKVSKFISYNNGDELNLDDKIDVANYTIYPADTIITQNPIPYSFVSEQELNEYLEMAKNETIDGLFEKLLSTFRIYLNAEEHTMLILAADTLYSYFQNRFGTTHYNIFVGENGSGKNSALLVIRLLGYRPFYVTSASPANYYTFLGDIQEGQGIILEDEADNIGHSPDKKNMLKTGYSSGGCVPKVSFTKDGNRYQESYLTFCFKCFAMEELPNDKNNRGIFDRSFIHHFFKGDVSFNIKNVISEKESSLYKNLIHLRKLLLVFKLVNQYRKFAEIKTNLTAREAELTYPLLKMFYGGRNFERIRKALSTMIYEKTAQKSNSIEAKIAETLMQLGNNENNIDKEIIYFTNKDFETKLKEIIEAIDNPYDPIGSTLYFSDGTKVSKYKISSILKSKFNAKPDRTSKERGYSVIRTNIERISQQYQIIKDIVVYTKQDSHQDVTQMTQVTDFKYATTLSSHLAPSVITLSIDDHNVSDSEIDNDKDCKTYSGPEHNNDNSSDSMIGKKLNPYEKNNKENNHAENDVIDNNNHPDQDSEKLETITSTTPSNCVTCVTNVTTKLPQYPCYFCGTNYYANIDFDMGNHFVEKHKTRLNNLPISGDLETRIDWAISETKRRFI